MLPRIANKEARGLDPDLVNVQQALLCGLIPGLIFDQRPLGADQSRSKMTMAMALYNEQSSGDPIRAYKMLLQSFITGDIKLIPTPLHIFVNLFHLYRTSGRSNVCTSVVHWIPLHFRNVMRSIDLLKGSWHEGHANALLKLFELLFNPYAKNGSGDNWEISFVIVLLIRCYACLPDGYFLPTSWFQQNVIPKVEYNLIECDAGSGKLLSNLKTWQDLKKHIKVGENRTIMIAYPPYASFEIYDAFMILYEDGVVVEARGFQMKEGSKRPNNYAVTKDFHKSFHVRGKDLPTQNDYDRKYKWYLSGETAISHFFRESGRDWTPASWQMLEDSLK
jgi:hypothetical protein